MIFRLWTLILLALWGIFPGSVYSQGIRGGAPTPTIEVLVPSFITRDKEYSQSSGVFPTPGVMELYAPVTARFESETMALVGLMDSIRAKQAVFKNQILSLQSKAQTLRDNKRSSLNVFEEAKLKACLNELQQKLEENSNLEKKYSQTRTEFEQKALSLLSFYNDWIDTNLSIPSTLSTTNVDERLNILVHIIRKRGQVQDLLSRYGYPEEKAPKFKSNEFTGIDPSDEEGRRMALDLLKDRKKNLNDHLDRISLREEELHNEIKLQAKLQDFLEDIQKMNEDSSFPKGSLRRNDLQNFMGPASRNGLEGRLAQLEDEKSREQQVLNLMNSSIDRLESRMGEKKGVRP